jgi:hypothetical protein
MAPQLGLARVAHYCGAPIRPSAHAGGRRRPSMARRESRCRLRVVFALEVAGRVFGCSRSGALRLRRPLHDVTGCSLARRALSPSNRARQHYNECTAHSQKLGMHNNLRRLRKRRPIKRARRRLCSAFHGEGCKCFAVAKKILAEKRLRRELRRRRKNDGAREPGDAGRRGRRVFHDLHHRRHVPDRSTGR